MVWIALDSTGEKSVEPAVANVPSAKLLGLRGVGARPHRRQAVGGTGGDRARPAPMLEAQRPAMGMGRRFDQRISEDVVEGVVDELEPGAQAVRRRLEHMFVRLRQAPDGTANCRAPAGRDRAPGSPAPAAPGPFGPRRALRSSRASPRSATPRLRSRVTIRLAGRPALRSRTPGARRTRPRAPPRRGAARRGAPRPRSSAASTSS